MNKETEDDLEAKAQRKLAQERKNDIEQKYKHILEKQEGIFKKGSKAYLRAVINSHWRGMNSLYKDVVNRRMKKRADALSNLDRFIKIYNKVSISWIKRAIRNPYISMFGSIA